MEVSFVKRSLVESPVQPMHPEVVVLHSQRGAASKCSQNHHDLRIPVTVQFSVHSHLLFKVTGFYRPVKPSLKVGLGIFDFCAISRRLISKIQFPHPISVADAICGTRFDLRDSKRREVEN